MITFPLTPPATPGFRSIEWQDQGNVGMSASLFTAHQHVNVWPAQWWTATVTLPAMRSQAVIGSWVSFFLALNGVEGTFMLGDSVRRSSLGTIAGALGVGTGAVANSTTLPLSGGTGSLVAGDWIQISTGSTARLHRVTQVNTGSVDVFPRLRSSHAQGTLVTYTNAVGVFRLGARVPWAFDERKIASGVSLSVIEAL